MQLWSIGIVCAVIWAFPVAAAAPKAPLPEPTSWELSAPLQAPALFAAGGGEHASPDRGAWISSDGKSVAFLTRESSAAEGRARAIVVKDVDTDTVVFEKVLFSEEESFQRSAPDLERLARARAWEARPFLAQHDWKPLPYRENPQHDAEFFSDGASCSGSAPSARSSSRISRSRIRSQDLQIWRRGKKVLDRRFPSWGVRKQWCEHANPSWLNGTFVSREHGVVLLELGSAGWIAAPSPQRRSTCSESLLRSHALGALLLARRRLRPGARSSVTRSRTTSVCRSTRPGSPPSRRMGRSWLWQKSSRMVSARIPTSSSLYVTPRQMNSPGDCPCSKPGRYRQFSGHSHCPRISTRRCRENPPGE